MSTPSTINIHLGMQCIQCSSVEPYSKSGLFRKGDILPKINCLKFKTPIIMHYVKFTGRPPAFNLSNATAFVNWLFHNHDSNDMIQVQHALIYVVVHVLHTVHGHRHDLLLDCILMYVVAPVYILINTHLIVQSR